MPKIGPGDGGGSKQEAIPASDYILALVWFQRRQSKSTGLDYLRCRFEVCSGPLRGRSFYAVLSCDTSRPGTLKRWQILMEVCGVENEFEIGDSQQGTGNEGDADVARLFMNRPFKATVKREVSGQYTNNDIEMIHYLRTWTDDDKFEMQVWLKALTDKDAEHNAPPPEDPVTELVTSSEYDEFDKFDGNYDDEPRSPLPPGDPANF